MGQETMGQRIKRLRDERGWRQADLEHESGLAHNQISDLENDRRPNPQQRTVERVAAALDVDPLYLREGIERIPADTTTYPAWGRSDGELSPKVRRLVRELIEEIKNEEAEGE